MLNLQYVKVQNVIATLELAAMIAFALVVIFLF